MTWTQGSLDDLVTRARGEGKVVVLDFTASWCAPCQAMERSVWPDPRVAAWLDTHALSRRVDADVEKELALRFHVRTLPSIVVLDGGEELDRRHGMTSAADLVGWLEGATVGKKWIDELREAARGGDVRAHHDLARLLRERGELDAALDELLWVWEHALVSAPEYVGVKHSFLVEELRDLALSHPPARARLGSMRDDAQRIFEASSSSERARTLGDWSSLCRASGDSSALAAWFDSLDGRAPADIPVDRLDRSVGKALTTDAQRASLGRMFPPAAEVIAKATAIRDRVLAAPMPDGATWSMVDVAEDLFRTHIERARRAYEDAGRADDVRALAAIDTQRA